LALRVPVLFSRPPRGLISAFARMKPHATGASLAFWRVETTLSAETKAERNSPCREHAPAVLVVLSESGT
jgi:hypothetical protein